MARGKRPVRGGKRKFDRRHERKPKPKKGKFNLREASYVKEREAKNEEIENRRKRIEEENARKQQLETDSSEEEEDDPMKALLATFSGADSIRKVAIESESDSESEEEVDEYQSQSVETIDNKDILGLDNGDNGLEAGENDDIVIKIKEDDEEDPETAQEDAGNLRDPFSIHLRNDLSDNLYEAVSAVPQTMETQKLTWPTLGTVIVQIPKVSKEDLESPKQKLKVSILEDKQFAQHGTVPHLINTIDWNKLHIKSQIQNNITRANYESITDTLDTNPSPLTPLQKELFSIINNYQDLYYSERTFQNEKQIRFIYCLHAINHILKTRTKVLHHNAKLSKLKKSDMSEVPDEYRDQGLVRPKVLIIVPFRHSCLKIVELLIAILIGEDKGGSVVNKKRFMEDFSGNEIALPKRNPKPEDYESTFKGNTDDTFKIGISITKKTLKLYSEFYSSDIIISSVLGLRMLVGAEGEPERDHDFLASIELLITDQTELFLMQNWDHFLHVLNHLHLQPKDSHGTDFSRVRNWSVNGWSRYYRQSLIFSSVQLPEINAIFNKKCFNYAGKVKVSNPISAGAVCQVLVQLPQVFQKFDVSNHSQAIEARMNFFLTKILPQYKDSIMNHTLIFVPSYFDFVKLRNYFKKEELSFVQICEYSKDAKVARARDMFFHSDAHFLIYSERFHFFRRIRLKGVRHVIFYAPPTFPHFYSEICNLMQEANQNPRAGSNSNMTVTTLYCKYDAMQLAAIVGSEKAGRMITSEKTVHMLVTGE